MSLLKKKMLLAPVLAVTLAFLLAGSVSFLPQNPSQDYPPPTSYANPTLPPPMPTSPPVAQSTTSLNGNLVSILFVVAAIAVGIMAACLLFSERSLKKEISE